MRLALVVLVFLSLLTVNSQNFYKTPSGRKYHTSSCRMVENVSKKISVEDIDKFSLSACKICKPKFVNSVNNSFTNKSVGKSISVRCKGRTKRGARCKHKTRLANGFCYQHTKQNSSSYYSLGKNNYRQEVRIKSRCGARTKSGRSCRRKVKGLGRCYQHR